MTALVGVALLAIGLILVAIARPRQGKTRPFVRGAFVELMYPVLCLAILVIGAAMVISAVTT